MKIVILKLFLAFESKYFIIPTSFKDRDLITIYHPNRMLTTYCRCLLKEQKLLFII